jgi:hypothetical protein
MADKPRIVGGKSGSGVYQKIISLMPPHPAFYGEFFLGSGAIMRRKRPAALNRGYEINATNWSAFDPGDAWSERFGFEADRRSWKSDDEAERLDVYNRDAFAALATYAAGSPFWGFNPPHESLIYLDPPYLMETRSTKQKYYQNELLDVGDLTGEPGHLQLLRLIKAVPCRVMISHYRCKLYDDELKGWRRVDIDTTNRAGKRVVESVYCNFPEPFELHDYRYLGTDFHDRDRIKKKKNRWVANLDAMPSAERYAIIGAILAKRDEWLEFERAADWTAAKKAERQAAKNTRAHNAAADDVVAVEQPELI